MFCVRKNLVCFQQSCQRFIQESSQIRNENTTLIPVIGLEIHAQINSLSKLFSGAPNKFMSPPNFLVSTFDASMPGTLPVLNKECVRKAILSALALDCKINKLSCFDRKHYFYADMPQGYQITQQKKPIAVQGHLDYPTLDGSEVKRVNIKQIQIEQDSGKSLHDLGDESFIDLNRAGVGLIEIVTAPDLHSADDAVAFVKALYYILKHIGTCGGKLVEGQFRVDVNISLKEPGGPLGTRTETKNISGLKHIHQVTEYEIRRQSNILHEGGAIKQETRAFDVDRGVTTSMRDKEVSQDYRFMPEPNLLPLQVHDDESIKHLSDPSSAINVDELQRSLPRLPAEIRQELMENFSLTFEQAEFLLERFMHDYFMAVMKKAPKLSLDRVFHFFRTQLVAHMDDNRLSSMDECTVTADQLCDLLVMQDNLEINESTAKQAFVEAVAQGKPPVQVVKDNDWMMISDVKRVTDFCVEAIEQLENKKLFAKYQPGQHDRRMNKNIITKVISHVLEKTDNKIHTAVAKKVVINLLDKKCR